MNLNLDGKAALVTGASRGIGKYIALQLAEEGMDVAICARGQDDLEETAGELEEKGAEVVALPLDLTDEGAAGRFVEKAADTFGRLDAVVGNVGGNRRGPFEELSEEDWDEIFALNFRSHTRTARAAIPHLRASAEETGHAALIYVSSIFGRELGGAGLSAYNTTKSAIISLAKVQAQELAEEGICVNTVAPGSIRFPGGSWDRRVKEQPDEMEQFIADNLPIGRFGQAEEVADLVAFLSSERASLLVGSCINVDGGQSASLI
ncbi:MAG: short-chain dehydrogenase [Bacteroidetes bacterium SW_4_67_19]|jgi:3-oxoacyl-[acyl-carrier protein] reductase|nr:MAG: short-chain dehydrogenase [Bacteroidetes bacterium SW_4_67_19]